MIILLSQLPPEIPSLATLSVAGSWAIIAFLFIRRTIVPYAMVEELCRQHKERGDALMQDTDKWEKRYLELVDVMKKWVVVHQETTEVAKELAKKAT